jgi:hypothetical protein
MGVRSGAVRDGWLRPSRARRRGRFTCADLSWADCPRRRPKPGRKTGIYGRFHDQALPAAWKARPNSSPHRRFIGAPVQLPLLARDLCLAYRAHTVIGKGAPPLLQLVGERRVPHLGLNPGWNSHMCTDPAEELKQLPALLVAEVAGKPLLVLSRGGESSSEQLTARLGEVERPSPSVIRVSTALE